MVDPEQARYVKSLLFDGRFAGRRPGKVARMFPMRRLDIYLNDHLAGSTVGVELSRRAWRSNRGSELGDFLELLHREIAEDRKVLEDVMERLGVDRSVGKPAVAWVLEKAGRLKLNGQLRRYSPLSRLVELEGLEAGLAGKRSLWQVLAAAFPDDARLHGIDLAELEARADRQLSGVAQHRRSSAPEALR